MSFNLSISGHIGDDEQAEQVDDILRRAGATAIEALAGIGVVPLYASFTGPTGFVNYLAPDPAPGDEATESS